MKVLVAESGTLRDILSSSAAVGDAPRRVEFDLFEPAAFEIFLDLLHHQHRGSRYSAGLALTQEVAVAVLPIAVFLEVPVIEEPILEWIERNPSLAALVAYDRAAPSAPEWPPPVYEAVIREITEPKKILLDRYRDCRGFEGRQLKYDLRPAMQHLTPQTLMGLMGALGSFCSIPM